MKRTSRIFAGVLAFVASSMLSLVTPANAQPPAQGAAPAQGTGLSLDLATMLKAKSGAWAEYQMGDKAGQKPPMTMRYALVEHTASKLALELVTTTPKGEMVVHFDFVPQGTDAWKVTGGKMQFGGEKKDLPPEIASAPPLKVSDSPGTLVGAEDVTTPLGVFPCKHYKNTMPQGPTVDVWLSDKVLPTGLVKLTLDPMGMQQTLVATGTGAQSKLH